MCIRDRSVRPYSFCPTLFVRAGLELPWKRASSLRRPPSSLAVLPKPGATVDAGMQADTRDTVAALTVVRDE
eukprot:9163056-Alexandrium_andersonii.AAC.1